MFDYINSGLGYFMGGRWSGNLTECFRIEVCFVVVKGDEGMGGVTKCRRVWSPVCWRVDVCVESLVASFS